MATPTPPRALPTYLHEIWRLAGRAEPLEPTIGAIAEVLARQVPLDRLVVLRLDPARPGLLETAAWAELVGAPRALGRREAGEAELEPLRAWAATGQVARGAADELGGELSGLVPEGLTGQVLAGGLRGAAGPLGVALVALDPPRRFGPGWEPLFEALLDVLAVAVGIDRRVRELRSLREAAEAERASLLQRLGRQDIADSIVGAQGGLRTVIGRVELVAPTDTPVLVLGETGTGKEVVARAIHARSARAKGPFLRVNCGAIPAELVDSELFGHERGSFTGASARRRGWFERADGGTLLLDEIGELSPAAQVRFLRILQDGTFQRVGGEAQLAVDVRVVASTHRDLRAMVAEGRFREDLWYRIAVFPIQLPALRERLDDIPALAAHFSQRAAARLGLPPQAPTREDLALLASYPWPGNVRELATVLERAAILGQGRRLDVAGALGIAPLPAPPTASPLLAPRPPPAATLDEAAARHIEEVLARTRGRIEGPFGAAQALGINPHTLRSRMRKLGIDWSRFRGRA